MSDAPLIEARGIARHFGHVQALQGADLSVGRGEIVGLIGDNGAGKSTLIRILSGIDRPDAGEIRVNGRVVHFNGPQDARAVGIETVYQDLALAPDLDAAANVFLGREILRAGLLGRFGVLDKSRMARQTAQAMTRLGVTIRASAEVFTLSGGQQQSAAVARAAMWATSAILMDEPTANLGVMQDERRAGSDPTGEGRRHSGGRYQPQSAANFGDYGSNFHSAAGPDSRPGRSLGGLCRRSCQSDDVRQTRERSRMSEPSEPLGGFTSTTGLPSAGRDVGSPVRRLQSLFGSQSAALFLVLVALAVFFSTLRPNAFPKIANIMNMATNASVLLVLGVGSTFVILTGGIDLSINGVLVFSGVIAAMAMGAVRGDNPGVLLVGLVGGVAAGTAWGVMNGFLVAKAKIPPLIVTLGTMGMSLGFALLLTRGVDISDVPIKSHGTTIYDQGLARYVGLATRQE
jgi:simple sugar transport system ATP-binding protein